MDRMMKKQPSRWWIESRSTTRRSQWLQSTLDELNEKTNTMLKLIEEDADSFAKRAEMYYKKRPELISMVEDFYRTHRSLAERYDQVKPETQQLPKNNAAVSPIQFLHKKWFSFGENNIVYDSYSEKSVDSEVDNPDKEDEEEEAKEEKERYSHSLKENVKANDEIMKDHHKDEIKEKGTNDDEVMKLREEIEMLRKENRVLKEQLKQKDEEKIEVIRHMSVAIDILKQENVGLRSFIVKLFKKTWKNPFEFNKFIGEMSGQLFNGRNGIAGNKTSVIAL